MKTEQNRDGTVRIPKIISVSLASVALAFALLMQGIRQRRAKGYFAPEPM